MKSPGFRRLDPNSQSIRQLIFESMLAEKPNLASLNRIRDLPLSMFTRKAVNV